MINETSRRSAAPYPSIIPEIRSATSGNDCPAIALLSWLRMLAMNASCTSRVSSITRCSTRPASVIKIIIMRDGVNGTTSTWRTRDFIIDGYCTTATCLVTSANRRTVRITTSSRSSAPSRKDSMARRSGADNGLTSANLSTNTR